MAYAMIGGALVPDYKNSKVELEALVCTTKLDGPVVIEVNRKLATCDMHMFGMNPQWTRNVCISGEANVVTVGKHLKTGDKGTAMMIIEYGNSTNDTIKMWDPNTTRVLVMQDIICQKHMPYQPVDTVGVLEYWNLICARGH
jgi:hypothetical protein